jgi:hypothetical protein
MYEMQARTRDVYIFERFDLLAQEIEGDGQKRADQEAPEESVVDASSTEHTLGTKSPLSMLVSLTVSIGNQDGHTQRTL